MKSKKDFAEAVYSRYDNEPNGSLGKDCVDFIRSDGFSVDVVEGKPNRVREGIIGTSFGSTQDYGRRYKAIHSDNPPENADVKTKEDLEEEVRDRVSERPRQINFVKKNDNREVTGVYTGVLVVLTENGYSILPDEDSLVTPPQVE